MMTVNTMHWSDRLVKCIVSAIDAATPQETVMAMATQAEKAQRFRELHGRPGAFIIPNPWDAGTARLLARQGFEALATTSLGLALTLGRSAVTPDEIIANCRAIAEATDLPVNADLENCGADEPKAARR